MGSAREAERAAKNISNPVGRARALLRCGKLKLAFLEAVKVHLFQSVLFNLSSPSHLGLIHFRQMKSIWSRKWEIAHWKKGCRQKLIFVRNIFFIISLKRNTHKRVEFSHFLFPIMFSDYEVRYSVRVAVWTVQPIPVHKKMAEIVQDQRVMNIMVPESLGSLLSREIHHTMPFQHQGSGGHDPTDGQIHNGLAWTE